MESAQLRHLRERAQHRLPRDDAPDVLEGLGCADRLDAGHAFPSQSPRALGSLRRRRRARVAWGQYVPEPRWGWTHAIEIEASAEELWPWIAQIGATRAGFYSYQWLENLLGCQVRNAETIHPEWELKLHDDFFVHPTAAPPLNVVAFDRGSSFVVYGPPDERARAQGRPWLAASWLFLLEPLGPRRCRFISRYRADYSDDLVTRLSYGPALLAPIGFAMDRRMLIGVKQRAERAARARVAAPERNLRSAVTLSK